MFDPVTPVEVGAALGWLAIVAAGGFLVSWLSTDIGGLRRTPYIGVLAGVTAVITGGYLMWSDAAGAFWTNAWGWGVLGAIATGGFLAAQISRVVPTISRRGRLRGDRGSSPLGAPGSSHLAMVDDTREGRWMGWSDRGASGSGRERSRHHRAPSWIPFLSESEVDPTARRLSRPKPRVPSHRESDHRDGRPRAPTSRHAAARHGDAART
jgi:hypothetical protein